VFQYRTYLHKSLDRKEINFMFRKQLGLAACVASLALNLVLMGSAFAGVCPGMPDVAVYTLDTHNNLYMLPAGAQNFTNLGQVAQFDSETLIGIDFRPADRQLYGITDHNNLYLIRPDQLGTEGAVSSIASFPFGKIFQGGAYCGGFQSLMDFNPVVDAIRLIGSNTQNYAIVNANGGTLNQLVRQTNISNSVPQGTQPPNITAGAYDNNFAGATSTIFYVLDHSADALGIVPLGSNLSSNTAGGVVGLFGQPIMDPNTPFGGPSINISPLAGLDIYTAPNGVNFGVVVNDQTLYCLGTQSSPNPQPGAPVSYDLNVIRNALLGRGGVGRIVATQAATQDLGGVGPFIDVAVALF
jgi:hypothetical protein